MTSLVTFQSEESGSPVYDFFVVTIDKFDFVTNVSPKIFRSGVKGSYKGVWSLNAGIR